MNLSSLNPIVRVAATAWPATEWQPAPIPKGYRWLNYLRGPSSFIWIREAGKSPPWRVYLGRPFPIAPDREYEILNRGYAKDGLCTAQTGTTKTIRGAFDYQAQDLVADPLRIPGGETLLAASLRPIPGGNFRARFRIVFTASVSASLARVTTEGLDNVSLWAVTASSDVTTMALGTHSPDAPILYAVGGWFLSQGLAITGQSQGMVTAHRNYFAAAVSGAAAAGVPIRECASILIASTFSAGQTVDCELFGQVNAGPAIEASLGGL